MSDYRFTVIICPKCGRPKIADLTVKTTKCPSCGRSMKLNRMRHYGKGEIPQDLIPIVGKLNQRRTDFQTLMRETQINEIRVMEKASNEIKPQDPDKGSSGEPPKDRISMLRQGMTEIGEFTVEEFTALFVICGGKKEKAANVLRGFMDSGDVYCPRKGFFRYIQ